ncbi:MAG: hypothetical protein R2836_01665 [Chitinophagales bacterium]|nr:hypothetical protein [Chitinophagales bacterium]
MKYLLSDNEGVVEEFSKITPLQNILNQSIDYWSRGTGDVGVEISNNERLIFFRITQGFFIMYHPEYLSPKTNSDDLEIYTHYIGGQKFLIPSTCICSKEQTLEILENFIDKGTLKDSYNWVDFYSELGDFQEF